MFRLEARVDYFQAFSQDLVRIVRNQGILCGVELDDFLIHVDSFEPCLSSVNLAVRLFNYFGLDPILPGGGGRQNTPPPVFLHHPKTAQGINLKPSDFKDTPLRHFLQVKPVLYILSFCHDNKITKGTSQNFASKKSEKSANCKDIEPKFGIEIKFVPLSSKTNVNLQFDVIMTFLAFRPFC